MTDSQKAKIIMYGNRRYPTEKLTKCRKCEKRFEYTENIVSRGKRVATKYYCLKCAKLLHLLDDDRLLSFLESTSHSSKSVVGK